jgi:hypothetical protein
MQGLQEGRSLCGWISEGKHRHLVFLLPCTAELGVFKNEQGWPDTQDPRGP